MNTALRRFSEGFATLNASNLERLGSLYAEDVHFTDPLHDIHGLTALRSYFENLYANVEGLSFDFHSCDLVRADQGYLRWTLHFCHPRLKGGVRISVEGCTWLTWDGSGKILRHRDFFDAGALLYEHVPLLGRVLRWLKGRLV